MANKSSVYNKINVTVALILVFLMFLVTNRIDKRHFDTAQNAVIAVHDDRVIAQDYLFQLLNLSHKQQMKLVVGIDKAEFLDVNNEINSLINLYGTTKLTTKESKLYRRLKSNFETLVKFQNPETQQTQIAKVLRSVHSNINQLALIQVSESKELTGVAQKFLDMNAMLSKIEIVIVILVILFIQFVVFHKVKKKANLQNTTNAELDN
jgi:hypothetical protein